MIIKAIIQKSALTLEAIKFSHTIFAMPFALMSVLLARRGHLPRASEMGLIVLSMVGARTWAMCINRLADADIDAKNPRTKQRALPAGLLGKKHFVILATAGAIALLVGAAGFSWLCLLLAVPLLAVLASYSYFKRFSFLCHFWLGFCLGCAPLGAWIALSPEFNPAILWLTCGILFWVAGFDIIYAIQDLDYDRQGGLHSVPSRWGDRIARRVALISHIVSLIFFGLFGMAFSLGWPYFLGIFFSSLLVFSQHFMMFFIPQDKKSESRFFQLNAWVAVLFLLVTVADLLR